MHLLPRRLQAGFTLIEIMVIAPIVILAIGAFVTVIISMTGEVLASRGSNALAYNIQDAINRIDQDVKLSTSFLAQNNITLTASEAQGYNDDATNFTNNSTGASGTSLILSMLVTNGNPLLATSGVVYIKDSPNACASAQVQDNTPMIMNVVYFVKNNTLWRRTIMPSNYASASVGCTTPWQQPSCATGYTAVFCKTNDEKLVEGVSSTTGLSIKYYVGANDTYSNGVASDCCTSVSARNTALSSTPTVGVSISASQTVAGRTIARSATLRSTRLETNASTVASLANTTPSTPVVTGSIVNCENATFSWPIASGGNVTYAADYNIDGGSWTSALSGSSSLSYSRVAVRGQTVNIRVNATNSAGTSSYGTTSVQIPLWCTVPFQNNWSNYDASLYAPFSFTKTSAGLVVFKGMIKRTGTGASSEVLFTLPPGYRPSGRILTTVMTNNAAGRIFIETNGDVTYIQLDEAWVSLNSLSFIPSGSGFTPSTLTPQGTWVNYDSAVYEAPTSTIDGAGRVNLRGLLKGGSTTADTNMTSLPVGARPTNLAYLPVAISSTTAGTLKVNGTTGFNTVGLANATYTSISTKFWPSSRPLTGADCTVNWCNLTLVASWVNYNSSTHPTAQYTKGSDGVVSIKGLIKSGTVTSGTTIFTLPAGYRPKERQIFENVCNGVVCRLDVFSTGVVQVFTGVSATYTSIENISFMAEQ